MPDIPHILVIGYCYPPTASPEAFVSAKLLRNIPDCKLDVLTLEDGLVSGFCDPEMGEYAAGINGEVIKVSPPQLIKYLCQIPRLPLRPDRWILANYSVHKRAKELMERKYDLMITRSQYHSAHLVGLSLKKTIPELPWIACFSDPWSESDHQPHVPIFSYFSRKNEQKVMELADHLVFPTAGLLQHMTKGRAALKSSVVPHCIDRSLYGDNSYLTVSKQDNTEYIWRIFGSFYGNRQPDILLEALKKIDVPEGNRISVEVFGSKHDKYNDFTVFNQTHIDRKITYKGQTSHKNALSLMQTSDLLIVIDSTDNAESFYLPSKIIDYFGSGANVLSICRPGTVETITQKRGDLTADIDNVNSICTAMEVALSTVLSKKTKPQTESEFEASVVGSGFRSLIDKIIGKSNDNLQ